MAIPGACGWRAWQQRAKDKPIVPTLKLFTAAKAKGVAVFFITGRCEIGPARDATEANLRAAGFDGWMKLYMVQPVANLCPISTAPPTSRRQRAP